VQLSKKANSTARRKTVYRFPSDTARFDYSSAWQLLNALSEVAVMTINHDNHVHYANPLACQLFKLKFDTKKYHFGKIPSTISQSLANHDAAFTLQYAQESEVRTLHVFVSRATHTAHFHTILYMVDSTQQRLLETQLRQTEALLKTLLDASPDYICIKDGNNRWLSANQKMLNLYQLSAEDYVQQSNTTLASQSHPIFKTAFQHAETSDEMTWRTHKPYHNEEILCLPKGSEITLDVTKIPTYSEDQMRQHLVMFAHDVTEQKFIETQLQNRSAILDALISCDWLLHSADSWHTVAKTVLQQSCLALRFTRGAILKNHANTELATTHSQLLYQWSIPGFMVPGKRLEAIDFNAPALARWREVLQKGNPVFCEISDLPAEERSILKQHDTVCIAIVPLFLDNAWWGNMIIERCHDATKTTSQELGSLMAIGRSLSVAIQREHAGTDLNLAKIAFDSASEGIMIIDTNGSIIGINKGFTDITGYHEEEILGSTPIVFQMGKHELWESLSTEGKWRGEITNHRKNGEPYDEWLTITVVKNSEQQITNYVGVFADITETKRSQNKLYELVNHDPLTGLPNRRLLNELFEHAIKRAERECHQIAILFIDLDRFKAINDSLGHQIGDKLLYEVSRRIKQSIRESDVVGRLGGDEFLVMMDTVQDQDDAAYKAKKILTALESEFLFDGKELFISASIGIAMFPSDGNDVDSVIKAADIAMYQVKNKGKNSYCFYTPEHSEDVVERFNLENQLRRALERKQFEVYYQPQMDILTGNIIGAEALVRWNHPDLGVISPAKFIPLAEETGIILQIGEWVLTEAAKQAKQWVSTLHRIHRIAVNVSGIQIMQSNFADTVYGILIETDCDPDALELEITESTVMQNTQHVINTFDRIKSLGVKLAIDDFGTGYSSLSNLKRLPLDKLKIDRSFVRDLPDDSDDAAIASAIYAMACSLGFTVIAEGVETIEQEQFLKNMGCTEAQGFLYSKPLTATEFTQLMQKNELEKEMRHEK
jgi:diguanylate cyclase (GGDEF)-like protein/PAS domain S-box-containing protein